MKTKLSKLGFLHIIVSITMIMFAIPSIAQGTPTWEVPSVSSTGCASGGTVLNVTFSNTSGTYTYNTIVTVGGLVYMNQDFVGSVGNGSFTWGIFADSTGGATTGTFPMPTGQQVEILLSLEQPDGTVLYTRRVVLDSCDTGNIVSNTVTFPTTITIAVTSGEPDSAPQRVFFDDRINDFDTGNSVVLYGQADDDDNWRLEIYNADQSGLLLVVSTEAIAAVPECPEENTLIVMNEETGVSLWRLPQTMVTIEGVRICPFQLNAPATEEGKTYIIIFDTLYPSTYYESTDEWIGR